MRCKFSCQRARELHSTYRDETAKTAEAIELYAVYGDSPEDREFAKATPNGRLDLYVDNPAAWGYFVEGRQYYLDITPADAG